MDTKPICPSCGKLLPPNAPKGLCPECLMKGAFPTGTDTGGNPSRFVPPTVEELAPQLPQLEIVEFIGQGGMGAVYKARQKELDRIVALKILPPDIGHDAAFAERFTREAKALAKLNHPGIVTIHDFGRANGLYFFLMEYVDGVNLRQLLHGGRISAREALAIVPQICDALQFAHDQGIVHRDIKPENILLDRRGRVKVADFGLAKIVGNNSPLTPSLSPSDGERVAQPGEGSPVLTDAGKVMGTPQYMSPEQLDAPGEVDHRADIYALGVVFYQMLTGELPGKKIEPPSKKVHVDVRLDEIVLRALEKNPELRYQQVSEVKTLVETIVATPPDKSRREEAQTEGEKSEVKSQEPEADKFAREIRAVFAPKRLLICAAAVFGVYLIGSLNSGLTIARDIVWICIVIYFVTAGFLINRHVWPAMKKGVSPAATNPLPVSDFWEAVEAGNYGRAWDKTALYFQRDQSRDEWIARMEKERQPLGKSMDRNFVANTVITPMTRTAVEILATFANGQQLVEGVYSAVQSDGEWKVEKYYTRPVTSDAVAKAQANLARLSRFSRTAIVGAVWVPFLFIMFIGMFMPWTGAITRYAGPAWWREFCIFLFAQRLPMFNPDSPTWEVFTILPLGLLAPLGATLLGWLAVSQIRHSAGKLCGLGLAVFDGLFFPLLLVDGAIAWLWLVLAKLFARQVMGMQNSQFLDLWDMTIWILLALASIAWTDYLIIRRVWRTVHQGSMDVPPADPSRRRGDESQTKTGQESQSLLTSAPTNEEPSRMSSTGKLIAIGCGVLVLGAGIAVLSVISAKMGVLKMDATGKTGATFGPVIETWIPDPAAGLGFAPFNFETGKGLNTPGDIAKTLAENPSTYDPTVSQWLRDNHADVILAPDDALRFVDGLVAYPTINGRAVDWDELTPDMAIRLLDGVEDEEEREAGVHFTSSTRATLRSPAAMVFKTREGNIGILQLLDSRDNPRRQHFRYKLVQNVPDAAARQQEQAIERMNAMRQFLIGMVMFKDNHADHWPDTLAQTFPYLKGISPEQLQANASAFRYQRPESNLDANAAAMTAVLFENHPLRADGQYLGFADGHVALTRPNEKWSVARHVSATPDSAPKLQFLAWQDEWQTNQPGAAQHPDGSPVTDTSELKWLRNIGAGGVSSGHTPEPRFLKLWFSHPLFDASSFNEVALLDDAGQMLPLAADGTICGSQQNASSSDGNLGWYIKTFAPGHAAVTAHHVTVRLRYTVGPIEQTNLMVDPQQKVQATLEGESMLNGVGQSADGKAFVSLAVNPTKITSRKFDVMAITKDGRELVSSPSESGFADGTGVSVAEFAFEVPLADVARFIIGTRPIRTMDWTNVVLPKD